MKLITIGSWGAYPGASSATSGYLLEANGKHILLDCGSGVLSLLQDILSLEHLDAVILSHYHTDHIADIYCLQYAVMILTQLGKRTTPLNIYAPTFDKDHFAKLQYGNYSHVHPISTNCQLELDDLIFTFAKNKHPVPCLSMRIEHEGRSLIYTADTEWSEEVARLSQGANFLLCECSLYNEQYGKIAGHLTAGEAGKLAAVAAVGRLVLTHLPHYGDHSQLVQEAREQYAGPITLTYTGNRFDI